MRRSVLSLTLALALWATTHVRAADDFLFSRFSDYLDALRIQAGIPGLSAAIVGLDAVNWEGSFGRQNVERNIAVRSDTPFQLDGITQAIAAALAIRCADDGWLHLDDKVSKFSPSSADGNSTIAQVLTHMIAGAGGLTFSYRLDRLAPVAPAISGCTDSTYRWGMANLVDRLAMVDTVPGSDVVQLTAPAEHFTAPELQRYAATLQRLATPYAVDAAGRATPSSYAAATLTPASGLISTVRDLEQFDLALKHGDVMRPVALAYALTPPTDANRNPLPHAFGWFVQTAGGEPVVWQFGVSDNASSSMIVMLPRRGLTLILLANSHGLARPFPLSAGDVMVSPFARLFLSIFAR